MGNENAKFKPQPVEIREISPASEKNGEINYNSIMNLNNTSHVEWFEQQKDYWMPWPEPVFYKLFLDPEGRKARKGSKQKSNLVTNRTFLNLRKHKRHSSEFFFPLSSIQRAGLDPFSAFWSAGFRGFELRFDSRRSIPPNLNESF